MKDVKQFNLQNEPSLVRFSESSPDATAMMFEPIRGFHFGTCGPVQIQESVFNEFYCDVPILTVLLILNGEASYTLGSTVYTMKKNMFFIGKWNNLKVSFHLPLQNNYFHIGFAVEEDAISTHFGSVTGDQIVEPLGIWGRIPMV